MDRGLQPAWRAGDDDARDEHDPAPAEDGAGVLNSSGEAIDPLAQVAGEAAASGCVVRVRIGTHAIRALFADEKPPVPDAEWDEAAYVEQRLRAYRDALESLASVRPLPGPVGRDRRDPFDDEAAATFPTGILKRCCARTGDLAIVDLGDLDAVARDSLRTGIERALQRVFTDAHAWRRCLLPAYFERHRSWRAIAGAPIQH